MRRFREKAQLSQEAVATRLGCSQTQVSRLEIAKRTPSKADAEKLDDLFGTTERQYFVGLYRNITSPGSPIWFASWADRIEPAAVVIRSWDPLLVPGLLQTPAYARFVLSQEPRISQEKVERRLQARLQRREILDKEEPPLLLVLMDVGVLRRPVGDAQVMAEQLAYLVEISERPCVSLQVVDEHCLAGFTGPFMIAEMPGGEPDVVHSDSSTVGHVTTDHALVTSVWNRYEAIRGWAYPEHVTLKMIKDVKREWT